jgi:glycosyltransferase involved in cell wall biosynthesis
VTEENQKRVLSKVMPAERIHVIPLGVHLGRFREAYQRFQQEQQLLDDAAILTVGNWLRDWTFLRETAMRAAEAHPHWHFHVVNREFDVRVKELLTPLSNVTLHEALSDDALKHRLYASRVLYIPVTAASGNNALLEAMAMGLPVVMTDVFGGSFMIPEPAVRLYEEDDQSSALHKLSGVMSLPADDYARLKATTFAAASAFDWEETARRTMKVYQMALTT